MGIFFLCLMLRKASLPFYLHLLSFIFAAWLKGTWLGASVANIPE